MSNYEDLLKNFVIEIRKNLITRDRESNIHALDLIGEACNAINSDDRQCLLMYLLNYDILFHYPRLIISDEVLLRRTLKVTLCLMEHDKIFKENFFELLKAHMRQFYFLSRDPMVDVRMVIDCVTFIQILQEG